MALYKTGTLAVNTAGAATGSGTSWTAAATGIRNGQTVLINTNPAQQFTIQAINSATSLTLSPAPASAIPAGTTYAILVTDALSVDGLGSQVAEAITYFKNTLTGRASSGANSDITSLGGLTTALSVAQGGTGGNSQSAAINNLGGFGSGAGNFAQGNDARFNSIDGNAGGAIKGNLSVDGNSLSIRSTIGGNWPCNIQFMAGNGVNLAYCGMYSENTGDLTIATALAGSPRYFTHARSGNFGCSGTVTCSSVIQTSDQDKKDDIHTIPDALAKINAIRGTTFIWKDTGLPSAGVIAQELKEVLPEAIGTVFDDHDEYGEVDQEVEHEVVGENGEITTVKEIVKTQQIIRKRDDSKRSYSVEYSAVIALAVQAINELSEKVRSLEAEVASLKPEQAS